MGEQWRKQRGEVLTGLISEMKPAPCDPENAMPCELVCFDGAEPDNSLWKELMENRLVGAKRFEIHCWSDEREATDLDLRFGVVKPFDWKYGTVIEGEVTEEFRAFILSIPVPGRGQTATTK